jgi:hypothetical protein
MFLIGFGGPGTEPPEASTFFESEAFLYLIILIGCLLIMFGIKALFEKPIEVVKDRFGNLAFKIYQRTGSKFEVRGYNGYPRRVIFSRYTDVKSYVDNHTQVIR